MATEAEKSFRRVRELVATAEEILELRDVLRLLANQDGEISKMAQARREHQDALQEIEKAKVKARADTDQAKSDLDKELKAYGEKIEGEKKKIAVTIAPSQAKLADLEAKIDTAKADLIKVLAERKQQLGDINDEIAVAKRVLAEVQAAREAARRSLGA